MVFFIVRSLLNKENRKRELNKKALRLIPQERPGHTQVRYESKTTWGAGGAAGGGGEVNTWNTGYFLKAKKGEETVLGLASTLCSWGRSMLSPDGTHCRCSLLSLSWGLAGGTAALSPPVHTGYRKQEAMKKLLWATKPELKQHSLGPLVWYCPAEWLLVESINKERRILDSEGAEETYRLDEALMTLWCSTGRSRGKKKKPLGCNFKMPFLDFQSSAGWKQIWNAIIWIFENQIIMKHISPSSKEVQKHTNVISIAQVVGKIHSFRCNKNIWLKNDQCQCNNKALRGIDLI